METIIMVLLIALAVFVILKVTGKIIKIIAFLFIVLIVCIYFGVLPASLLTNIIF